MSILNDDALKLKAAIEFGPDYAYKIRTGGFGRTLHVLAGTKEKARVARKNIPGNWEGLYVIVLYTSIEEEKKDDLSLS